MGNTIKFPGRILAPEYTFLPITMGQFEALTNEILGWVNAVANPKGDEDKNFDAEYFAQILTSAIHALDKKLGKIKKRDLFEACLNRISCHVTYHVTQEIQERIKKKAGAVAVPANPHVATEEMPEVLPDEVRGELPVGTDPAA